MIRGRIQSLGIDFILPPPILEIEPKKLGLNKKFYGLYTAEDIYYFYTDYTE